MPYLGPTARHHTELRPAAAWSCAAANDLREVPVKRALTLITLLAVLALLVQGAADPPAAEAADSCDVTLGLSRSKAFVNDYIKFRGSAHTSSGRHASGTVTIQKRRAPGGSWADWRTDGLDADGVFVKRVRMTSSNRVWEFRVRMPAIGLDDTGYSPVRTLTVQGPNPTETNIINLVNKQRTTRGLRPVRVRYDLTRAARVHSRDMARRNRLTHRSGNGDSTGRRLRRYGYTSNGYRYWSVGEDIAWGRYGTQDATPETIVRRWMRSSAHRKIILKRVFRDAGVGVAKSGSGRRYFTLDMGRRTR
jgi:uncharacterized protein YkwD